MPVEIATTLVSLAMLYALIGAAFSLYFVFRGVGRIDENAKSGTLGFRLLIIPGVVIFWPLLAVRLARGQASPPVECNAHRRSSRRVASDNTG